MLKSLITVLQTLRSRTLNSRFDRAVRNGEGFSQDMNQTAHEGNGLPEMEDQKRAGDEDEDSRSTSL